MFTGYTPEAIDFLWGIRFNNEREWFQPRKEIYTEKVLKPTKALAEQVYEGLTRDYPDLPVLCKVSRIYRDARRLYGRGPYKDHLWFSIRSGAEDWTGRPTFYFEIRPEGYSFGMGFWCAEAITMECFRRAIDDRPGELEPLVEDLNRRGIFTLEGQEYAKGKVCANPLLAPWYRKKNIDLTVTRPADERLFSPELAEEMVTGFRSLMPLYFWFEKVLATVPEAEARKNQARQG